MVNISKTLEDSEWITLSQYASLSQNSKGRAEPEDKDDLSDRQRQDTAFQSLSETQRQDAGIHYAERRPLQNKAYAHA